MQNKVNLTTVQTAADMQAMDLSKLAVDNLPSSIYQAILKSAQLHEDKIAIQYLLDGDCLDPARIPLKKKLLHRLLKMIKGKSFAEPYREVSYRELAQRVTQLTNALVELGVGRQDVTSIVMPNFPETYYSLWAAETAGIANPINPLLDSSVIKDIMIASGTKVLIGLGPVPGSDIWEKILEIKEQVPSLQAVISVFGNDTAASKDQRVPVFAFDSLLGRQSWQELKAQSAGQTDVCSYFHTGGTTGLPKLAKHLHLNELTNAAQMMLLSPKGAEDRVLIGLPIFHVNSAVTGLSTIMKGGTIIMASPSGFRGKNVIKNLLNLLNNYDIANMTAVPTVYAGLLETVGDNTENVQRPRSMDFALVGAAPLSEDLQRKFKEKIGISLVEGYGSTEGTAVSTVMPPDSIEKEKSVGLAIPGIKVLIGDIDENGQLLRLCDVGEAGEILIAGNNVFPGYVEEKHNINLWVSTSDGLTLVRTGDLGKIDNNGYLSLCGRKKELIIRGGHNIDPKMIEDVAATHPDVLLAAAVPRPDSYAGELPALYVTTTPASSADEATLLAYMREHVPERAAIPKSVIVLDEMPLTAVGKIYKPVLVGREIKQVVESELADVVGDKLRAVRVRPDHHLGFVVCVELDHSLAANDVVAQEIKSKFTSFTFVYELAYVGTGANT